MSDPTKVPDIPVADTSPSGIKRFMEAVREVLQVREGRRGDALDKGVTYRDLVSSGLAQLPKGSVRPGAAPVMPAPSTGGNTTAPITDMTPPPSAAGLVVTGGFATHFVEWTAPVYSVGGGHAYTEVWGAVYGGSGPLPTFANAKLLSKEEANIFAWPGQLGITLHVWLVNRSKAGVAQVTPTGGTNGVSATTGRVGNADLAPLAVDAANLAQGAVDLGSNKIKSADKFGAIAVGYTVTQYLLAVNGVMQNLIVDNAQISDLAVGKLRSGSLSVGQSIYSAGFSSGNSGWIIRADGTAEFGAASIRGQLVASQIDSRGLSIKDASGNVILAAGTPLAASNVTPAAGWLNSNQQWADVGGRPIHFIVRANGYDAVAPAGWWTGMRNAETDAVIRGSSRSWMYVELRRDGSVANGGNYDVYMGAGASLRDALNATPKGNIVALWTYDEPRTNLREVPGLIDAMVKCGASRAMLNQIQGRYAYILVGVAGAGEGAGAETVTAGGADAWAETSFSLFKGVLNVSSASGGPKSVRDLDYTGDLNADSNSKIGINSSGVLTGIGTPNVKVDNSLVAPSLGAINRDPGFADFRLWEAPATINQAQTTMPSAVGRNYVSCSSGVDQIIWDGAQYPIDPQRRYNLSANLYAAAGNNRNIYLVVDMFDVSGNRLTPGWGGSYSAYTFGGQPPTGMFTRQGRDFGAGTRWPIPSNAVYCRIAAWFQYSGAGTSQVEQGAQDLRLVEVSNSLVIDTHNYSGCSARGGSVWKAYGTQNAWDAKAFSVVGYEGGASVRATGSRSNGNRMFGLSNDRGRGSDTYVALDHAFYLTGDNWVYVYEAGNQGDMPRFQFQEGDQFEVIFDGAMVRYMHNGSVRWTSTRDLVKNKTFFAGFAFYEISGAFHNVQFTPAGSTSAVHPLNPITPFNASTLIQRSAIGAALIGQLTTENITVTTVSRAVNGIPDGSAESGLRVQVVRNGIELYASNNRRVGGWMAA